MKPSTFNKLSKQEQEWVDSYIDGTIEAADFEALQEKMLVSSELREVMRRYLALDDSLQNFDPLASDATKPWQNADKEIVATKAPLKKKRTFPAILPIAIAATLAFFLGSAAMQWHSQPKRKVNASISRSNPNEPSANGFAVVVQLYDAIWEGGKILHREGDTLGTETFQLTSGTAEIQFFSGANMTVSGPARISLKSAWEAACHEGAVRMRVPPAARGFKLHAPTTEITDLGTEFGLVVKDGKGKVEVFDGEIAVRHQDETERLVKMGAALQINPDTPSTAMDIGETDFPDIKNFGTQAKDQQLIDFQKWESHRDQLASDSKLIAYYTFDERNVSGLVPNLSLPKQPDLAGAVILAETVSGRWPGIKSAMAFSRPGARVRVNIDGEFSAFTFISWVRIDSLDRWYNALFMGDGYETGEPHWQIRNDGKMMLSVMVDDARPNPHLQSGRGFHQIYFSPPIWDMSMSGKWMHLASVFDPAKKAVSHFVNGERIARVPIKENYLIDKLRIGNAEIGNWGEPSREDPTFAIRNLNGRIDELAILEIGLTEKEVKQLFDRSRVGR